jgi:hypothetical protein
MKEGTYQRLGGTIVAWWGSAHAATMAPSQGKRWWHIGKAQHNTSTRYRQGVGWAARGEARGRHGQNPRCRRRRSQGHREAISEISRTGKCTIARSTERAPSRRLALAGVVQIEGVVAVAIQSRERARGGEGWREDWPGRGRPSHLVGLNQVGWHR